MKEKFHPCAIIGYGCVLPPDSYNVERFWDMVISGKSGIQVTPKNRWDWEHYFDEDRNAEDKTYCKFGAYLEDYSFPKSNSKLAENEIKKLNRAQLMLLDSINQAMSCLNAENTVLEKIDTGLFLGNMLGDEAFTNFSLNVRGDEFAYYLDQIEAYKSLSENTKEKIKTDLLKKIKEDYVGIEDNVQDNIIHSALLKSVRDVLEVKGTTMVVDAACGAGTLVMDEAIKHLQNNKLKTCIVSGVLGNISVTGNVAFAKVGGLSPTHSAPLDHSANGLIPGEGSATFIVKRLDAALADNDEIYAVIRGVGSASDGKGKSIYAPSSVGQVQAMQKALDKAGLKAKDINYVEAHATGTGVGDKVEIGTITKLFEGEELPEKSVAIGSIKSQIGHCFSAAGMANLVKVVEGMRHNIVPPTHNFTQLPDGVDFSNTPFYVNTTPKKWEDSKDGSPKRASVNAFGFGGINGSIVVEEFKKDYHKELVKTKGESSPKYDSTDIAIVGVGCIDSESVGVQDWYNNLDKAKKVDFKFPEDRWNGEVNEIFQKHLEVEASFIHKLEFPWLKYKIPPTILPQIDKGQQMALMTVGEALEDYGVDKVVSDRTCVYVGASLGLESCIMANLRIRIVEYIEKLKQIPEFSELQDDVKERITEEITQKFRSYIPKIGEDTLPGYMDNIMAGRIANFYDIQGVNAVIDSDTTSFMSALEQALMSLKSGEYDTAIVGGVHANLTPEMLILADQLKQRTDNCGFCNSESEEFVPTEGAVFFVLKRQDDVKKDEKVYARIKGMLNREKSLNDTALPKEEITSNFPVSYSGCCNSFKTENNKHAFYFGAQAGFSLLKVALLQHYNQQDKLPLVEKRGNNLTSIYSHSMLGGDYALLVDSKDSDRKYDSFLMGAKTTDEGFDSSKLITSDEIISATENVFYMGAESLDKLAYKVDKLLSSNDISSETKVDAFSADYRMAIVYKDEEELIKRLKAVY